MIEQNTGSQNKIMAFETKEELIETINYTLNLTEEEYNAWEEQEGYTSYFTAAEKVYNSKKPEDFKSLSEVKDFVAANSKFLALDQDENGEYEMNIKYDNDSYVRVMNADCMFQVNDSVYRVYANGVAGVEEEKKDLLYCLSGDDLVGNSEIKFFAYAKLKSTNATCGISHTERATNGRDRTKITVEAYRKDHMGAEHAATKYIVRPYKKTMGVWYHCRRRISCSINTKIQIYNYGKPDVVNNHSFSRSNYSGSVLSGSVFIDVDGVIPGHGGYDFIYLNCWGDTPSTSHARIYCNSL